MKTIAQPDPRTVRARWVHRKGNRLLLAGHVLWVASTKGPYRVVGEFTDDDAGRWATRKEFRRIPTGRTNGSGDRETVCVDRRVTPHDFIGSINFQKYVEKTTDIDPCRVLEFAGNGTLVETVPFTVPVSWILELYGPVAYLRQLAKHRRAARKKGMVDIPYKNQKTA